MVQDTGNLAKEGSNVLCAIGDFDVQELLNGKSETLLVCHHGNVVQTVKVRQSLEIGLVLDQLFRSSVQQADVRIGSDDFFTTEFENQSQHTVGGRVLGSEVDSVVSDFAILHAVVARFFVGALGVGGEAVDIAGHFEVLIRRDQPRADGLGCRISSKS